MLREELEFKMRMRESLHGIVQLDPEGIPARLIELDREIRMLERGLDAEKAAKPVVWSLPPDLRAA